MSKLFKKDKGYTLLFSIIVSSIILSIAAFILTVSRRQFILSASARDSTIAVYAADSAIQCAVRSYFDNQFSTSSSVVFNCEDQLNDSTWDYNISVSSSRIAGMGFGPRDDTWQISSPIQFSFRNGSCARVTVTAGYDTSTGRHKTVIDSRGYAFGDSQPCNDEGEWNPRSVERAIRLVYHD